MVFPKKMEMVILKKEKKRYDKHKDELKAQGLAWYI